MASSEPPGMKRWEMERKSSPLNFEGARDLEDSFLKQVKRMTGMN